MPVVFVVNYQSGKGYTKHDRLTFNLNGKEIETKWKETS